MLLMQLTIFGTGYVGLVTGADFACRGIDVTCVDIDETRIANLTRGVMPFFEDGLPELVARGVADGRLRFTIDGGAALCDADVVMCAVGTPSAADGTADLRAVFAVAELFACHAKDGAVLVNKSTVPVGTAEACAARINDVRRGTSDADKRFSVVSNPEFLSQSTAVRDTARPTRIVVGADDDHGRAVMRELNASFLSAGVPYCAMSQKSAEAVKCAANAFLATKISFANEMANFCEAVGSDVDDVTHAIGLDPRIGPHFLRAGLGYGGGCLSKDVRALLARGAEAGSPFSVLAAVEAVNDRQKIRFYEKFVAALDGVAGKTVAVWGLSFKPGTDDVRNAPSLTIVAKLLEDGATVRAFDPAAMDRARAVFPSVTYAVDAFDAARGAEGLLVLTEWPVFAAVDTDALMHVFSGTVIGDGRGVFRGRRLPENIRILGVGVDK